MKYKIRIALIVLLIKNIYIRKNIDCLLLINLKKLKFKN